MNTLREWKEPLPEYLRELHLPAIRRCFEEKARQAERETLGYEQYLLELVERECQERRASRITRLLQVSKRPLEKTIENFDMKRLPAKASRQAKALLDGDTSGERSAFSLPGRRRAGLGLEWRRRHEMGLGQSAGDPVYRPHLSTAGRKRMERPPPSR